MVLNRYPIQAAQFFRGELSNLFDNFFNETGLRATTWPTLNLWEKDEVLYAEAELPGIKMNDIEVSVVGNQLTLKGKRISQTEETGTFHRRERAVGEFTRTVTLPVDIDNNAVEATLKDGILTIKLPKAAKAQPRKIEVRSA